MSETNGRYNLSGWKKDFSKLNGINMKIVQSILNLIMDAALQIMPDYLLEYLNYL